jgi:hypothetical protein
MPTRITLILPGSAPSATTVSADLVILEGAGHGFKGPEAEKAERAIVEFLDSRLNAK